ncbi:MAG TPA: integrase core domain-containing protein [Tepidisphaeraceae bacterium]|nr:integrase core domain-containing protein [Tepidisphaeraceae bacterium]
MLIHDANTKFSREFKAVWQGEGVECKQIAHRAPRQNSFAENFVGTIKRECLNHFLCFSLDHPDYINRTWVRHYHTARHHRGLGIGNRVLDEQFKPQRDGPVKCREKLGGLIREYYREAA